MVVAIEGYWPDVYRIHRYLQGVLAVRGCRAATKIEEVVDKDQPLFTLHSETKAELEYALTFFQEGNEIIHLEPI
ncbi:MAG: hypothetical protein H0U71_01620 [Gammaproteobacteria bacterium]|nr:hypothetical protein [Gammaproteobacteria bacterium]